MRLGSAGLAALLWSSIASVTSASPVADNGRPMPVLRPRQTGTGATPTPTPTPTPTETPTTTTTSAAEEESTTTVTVTTTVGGGGGGGTVTATTVFLRTITTTILVTSTNFETTTVTSNDVATATVTNYVTSTVLAKRSLNLLPAVAAPVEVPAAQITPANDLRRFGVIEKRALVTVVVTVSGSAAGVSTVLNTRTSTVVFTTTANTVITSLLTSTLFNNAQTTITVESTLTVTSTAINTAAPTTVENGPTTGIGTATQSSDGASNTGGSGSGGSDGLSTGAKAGIGAGVGIVGLVALIAFGWWFYKRRKASRPSRADLDDMRAYDPNGPNLNTPVGMSETGAGFGGAAAATGTMRRQPVPKHQLSPQSQSVSPVSNQTVSPANNFAGGGHARPPTGGAQELGGTRILPAEMGGDEVVEMGDSLPQHPTPQQQRPAPGLGHESGPVPDLYEMPTERYR